MFAFPDLSKMQALFEEGLQSFAQVQADVKEIKAQQAEILALLKPKDRANWIGGEGGKSDE